MDERRRGPRYRLDKILGVELDGLEYSAEMRVLVLDVSAEGLRLTSADPFPDGEWLGFKLRLPGKLGSIRGAFTVRWQRYLPASERHEVGLEFLELSDECWRTLRDFIDSLANEEKKPPPDLTTPWRMSS